MLESRLYRETVAAAEAFHARKLWREFANDDSFAVAVPGEEHPLFASIMGQAGEEFGLLLLRGPEALACLMDLLDRDPQDRDLSDKAAFLSFSMGRYDETPPFGRSFLAKARFVGRGSSIVPCFMVVDAGRQPRAPSRGEVEKLLYALKGILKAIDAGMLTRAPLRPGKETPTLVIGGDPLDPEVSMEFRRFSATGARTGALSAMSPRDLSGLPRLPACWLIGCPILPVSIANDDRTVRMALVVEDGSGLILVGDPVQGGVPEALERICDAFHGENTQKTRGIPEEVLVANRELFNALWPVLDPLGVQCRYEPALPLLDQVLHSLGEWCDGSEAEAELACEESDAVPAADHLEGWKSCDSRLCRRAQARLARQGGAPDRAISRYFGDIETGEALLQDAEDVFPCMCFFEWLWLDYRATKKSMTLAETMLAGPLPRAERLLLETRLKAIPSVFKVQSIQKGASLGLLDVLFGGEATLHDKALSESAVEDMSFPARVFPAGDFHFASPLGPPLSALDVDAAIDWLEYCGMKLTSQGTRAKAHVFGRLWDWMEERRAEGPPQIAANMDGEKLCFCTATYAARDEDTARSAIAAREDIEWDEDDDTYVWERQKGREPGALIGDSLTLGTLRFLGDELLLEVNSVERLKRARTWLDHIPGIAFHTVRSRSLEDALRAAPPPDDQIRKEVPMTPELVAHIRDMMHQHYIQWLDTPLPILGGKTPREACATTEGKQRVARIIRTMPKPMGPADADVDVPRQEMLKALGLEDTR